MLKKNTLQQKKKSGRKYLLFCALIPMVVMYLIYVARDIYPFGDSCVLVLDLNGQYVWFYEALRDCVYNGSSLIYSFSRALGGDFVGIYAYYIASPLSYIVCLFPEDCMLEALLTIFLIKTGLCGLTFGIYIHYTEKTPSALSTVIFSTFYALSSYCIVQQHNSMWIDAVMWLPIISLGMERLIKKGKFGVYTFFLALTLFSNFYIGYMVCFYCLFYFFVYYWGHPKANNPRHERLHFIRSLLRVGFCSLLAIGMASVILLGAYYSLSFGKTTFSTTDWTWAINFDYIDFLYKLLPGSYDTVRPAGLPFVYGGLLTLLMLPSYFLSHKYKNGQKIAYGAFLIILFACMFFSVPDLILHGFQAPNWLNYRYSFMFTFIMCMLACRGFSEPDKVSLKVTMGTAGLIGILCVILQNYSSGDYINPDEYFCLLFTLVFLFIYLGVLGAYRKAVNKRYVSLALTIVVILEVFLNGLFNTIGLDEDVSYSHYSYYNDFLDNITPIVNEVQEADDSFYRMEKTIFRKTNDNMALQMRGLSGSTSTLNVETIQFLNKMGYTSKSHWSKYNGGTPVNDSLLGIKYIISDKEIYKNYYQVVTTDEETGYTAYLNPYALSIAYGVQDGVLDFPLGYIEEEASDEEATGMTAFVKALKAKLNEILDMEETNRSADYEDEYDSPFERLNAMLTAMTGETTNVFKPLTIEKTTTENLTKKYFSGGECGYTATDSDFDGVITYRFTTKEDGEVYFYLPTDYPREVRLTLMDEDGNTTSCGTFNGSDTGCIVSLGLHEAGETLLLEITPNSTWVYMKTGQNCIYYIDWDAFDTAFDTLSKDQFIVEDYTESELNGTITTSFENETIMTTLAYDAGWKIYVDGEEVEIQKALGSLVAFTIDTTGTHTLTLKYEPHVLVVGLYVSLGSCALFGLCVIVGMTCKNVPILNRFSGIPKRKIDEKKKKKKGFNLFKSSKTKTKGR